MKCPICHNAELNEQGEGRLDQSGMTYLPARKFICPKCPDTEVTLKVTDVCQSYPNGKMS